MEAKARLGFGLLIFGILAWSGFVIWQGNRQLGEREVATQTLVIEPGAPPQAQAPAAKPAPVARPEPTPAPAAEARPPRAARRESALPTQRIPMSFSACLRRIRAASAEMGVAPINVVETNTVRIVRFNTASGSVLITCDGDSLLMTDSPHRG